MAAREGAVAAGEIFERVGQHLMKQIEFAHQFLDPVALPPTDLAMLSRIAFDRRLDPFEIFDIERRAESFQYFRQMIGELLVSQLVRFDEIDVAGNGSSSIAR